jgi:uncharacterized protein (TIGR02246 family)
MPTRNPAAQAVLMASPDETEAQFYEAMQAGDIDKLMAVWADDDEVVCVHPGGARMVGLAAIRASFEAIFAQNAVPVQPEQVHRLHSLDCAVHHLAERVQVLTNEGPQSAWALATNVYVKTAQGWRMVAHHASPGQMGEPPPTVQEMPSTLH